MLPRVLQVTPDNAIPTFSILESLTMNLKDQPDLFPGFSEDYWMGMSPYSFETAGPVVLIDEVNFSLFSNETNNSALVNQFFTTYPNAGYSQQLVFSSVNVVSIESIQQTNNNNETLSLDYFVLFLGSLEVAVVIYEHSEDKDKKQKYDAIKNYKESLKETKYD